MISLFLFSCVFFVPSLDKNKETLPHSPHVSETELRFEDSCDFVCRDLPKNDNQPVCMMFSRYKKYYQFFVNECQARRAICKENLLLHLVHQSRCLNSNQYYMPVN